MNLAGKIVTLRKQKGLSQEALAEQLNVSRQAVSRWEMGNALPDATNILQLSKLFDVSTDYLLNDDYNSDQDIPAVKNQKEFILLIGLQIIAFIFHIVSCSQLASFFIFPIISLIVNIIIVKKLKVEFNKQHYISETTIKLYFTVYICIICFMFIIPSVLIFHMLYCILGF